MNTILDAARNAKASTWAGWAFQGAGWTMLLAGEWPAAISCFCAASVLWFVVAK
jgi:hypothetical protein